ncbi:MAG: hypothetical protein AN484_26530, partial [Aphanizomenon flos-aquae WA102]
IITRSGASMYVTHCNPVDVLPRTALNCTDEIPVTYNGTDVFVDPISMVIKSAGVITRCNDVAPPRWLIAGRWYCSYPAIKDCADPEEIPVQAVLVDEGTVVNQGLGRSIYSKEQLEEFVKFQDSHQVRKAYWAETAEIAYGGRGEGGEWGLGLGDLASQTVVAMVGMSLIPLYRFIGPAAITIIFVLFLVGLIRLVLTLIIRAYTIIRVRGPGVWLIAAFWGTLYQIALSPLRWADNTAKGIADRVAKEMELNADDEEKRPLSKEEAAGLYQGATRMLAGIAQPWRQQLKNGDLPDRGETHC